MATGPMSPRQFVALVNVPFTPRTPRSRNSHAVPKGAVAGIHMLTRGSKVVDAPAGRVGILKTLSRSHAKVEFDEGTELLPLYRLAAWTAEWASGAVMGCLSSPAPQGQTPSGQTSASASVSQGPPLQCKEFDQSIAAQLRTFLKTKYGGLLQAWHVMDNLNKNALHYKAFTRALKRVGFPGNIKHAWDALLPGDVVSYAHLHPEGDVLRRAFATAIEQYLERCRQNGRDVFSSIEEIWTLFNYENGGYCSIDHFRKVCSSELHWNNPKQVTQVFKLMHPDTCRIDDIHLLLPSYPMTKPKSNELGAEQLRARFMEFLKNKYGTVLRAWQNGIDEDGDEKLTFSKFSGALQRMGWKTQLMTLWNALQNGKARLTLSDIEPQGANALDMMETFFMAKGYDYLEEAWNVLDVNKNGQISLEEFATAMTRLGWRETMMKFSTLFDYIALDGCSTFTMDDFHYIVALPRKYKVPIQKLVLPQRKMVTLVQLAAFRKKLLNKFGNLIIAWNHMNPTGSTLVSFDCFTNFCQSQGTYDNIPLLWDSLDVDRKGNISIQDFAPEDSQSMKYFRDLVVAFFGTQDRWWVRTMASKVEERSSVKAFCESCHRMGIKREAAVKILRALGVKDLSVIGIEDFDWFDMPRGEARASALPNRDVVFADFVSQVLEVTKDAPLLKTWRMFFVRDQPADMQLFAQIDGLKFVSAAKNLGLTCDLFSVWEHVITRPVLPARCSDARSECKPITKVTASTFDPDGFFSIMAFREELEYCGFSNESAYVMLFDQESDAAEFVMKCQQQDLITSTEDIFDVVMLDRKKADVGVMDVLRMLKDDPDPEDL